MTYIFILRKTKFLNPKKCTKISVQLSRIDSSWALRKTSPPSQLSFVLPETQIAKLRSPEGHFTAFIEALEILIRGVERKIFLRNTSDPRRVSSAGYVAVAEEYGCRWQQNRDEIIHHACDVCGRPWLDFRLDQLFGTCPVPFGDVQFASFTENFETFRHCSVPPPSRGSRWFTFLQPGCDGVGEERAGSIAVRRLNAFINGSRPMRHFQLTIGTGLQRRRPFLAAHWPNGGFWMQDSF